MKRLPPPLRFPSQPACSSAENDAGDKAGFEEAGIDPGALREAIEQLPDMDATRIVSLYNRIMADQYEVDAGAVMEKLLDLEARLFTD